MARSSVGLGLACFAVVVVAASATQFRVGGQKGWTVPDAGFEPYNTWAGRLRFLIGDQLLFVYPKETDSVLLVDPAAYNACNVTSYVNKFDDGNTVFTFDHSGPFFFISGNESNCRANEKLIVVVLADRTPPGAAPTMSPPSPAPMPPSPSSPTPAAAPALSPSSPPPSGGAAPIPAPAATPASPPSPSASAPATPGLPPAPMAPSPSGTPGAGGASQPPSASAPGGEGSNSTTPPPPSAAAPVVASLVGSLGAFIGYAMLAA